ncbi:hypothetical protein PHLCEN_2v8398 [Hermanssonia centrifuga]|uniref:Uncharacterized protein n=1 Tax=Hermanssonia centrifuga TaxID=98765 RepID=A0A2R6NTW2_9APHY|nr:hypothetical protein PHLCEN_2v8398 [Hermanssonia centrifuga]
MIWSGSSSMKITEIWIWDWKTGELKLNLYGSYRGGGTVRSFTILSEQRILIPMVTGGVTDPGADLLAIFDCSTGDPTRRTYQQAYETSARAVFHLPQIARTATYARIDLYGNPYSSHGPPEEPEVPFVYDRNSRLLVFEIAVLVSGRCAWNHYMMFISAETLECHSKHNDVPVTKTIGWADWAIETRIITGHRMIYSAHISHM